MGFAKKAVLIVDDMKTVRVKLSKLCKELGVGTILEATDGNEALTALCGAKVDLILSDWNMPNMNGLELVGKIRENPEMSKVPVIFITAENEKGAILKSLMSGVNDYIVKPFPDDTVKLKISTALTDQEKT